MIKVVCAIAIDSGKLLVGKRSEDKRFGGFWELIGGKVQPGEAEEIALVREIKEELGVESIVHSKFMSHIHNYGGFTIDLNAFFIDFINEPKNSNSHSELAYFNIEDLQLEYFLEADIPILKELQTYFSEQHNRKYPNHR